MQSHRPNLSTDIAAELREWIFDGRLPAGGRINEVRLAASLGVSRTPLREALAGLTREGALLAVPRKGLSVRELTAAEARDIYPIRSYLDPEALRLSGLPPADGIARLVSLHEELASATDVRRAIELDDEWHRVLWADCPNPVLVELIEQFMLRTHRYELAAMRERRVLRKSSGSKAAIVDALRNADLPQACQLLRQSLERGVIPVLEWLEQRNADAGSPAGDPLGSEA
ncbi:MAG: GntR family transcriptional regulator [Candidatus Eisenbacteria bacterium]|uniref:GntR family transcriptional regulator n=1 Tax=Eiseniibacteriota bacterium TaxID=2212470 RepID=A0A956LYD3_UNCEI|nr:GntR family transcriptional regulator [Candidatus Eisenbacteria bacterium]